MHGVIHLFAVFNGWLVSESQLQRLGYGSFSA